MRCLHLMPMHSSINADLIHQFNLNFDPQMHLFVLKQDHPQTAGVPNCITDPSRFSVEYLNQHYAEYCSIFLHSLYLTPKELCALHPEAVRRIIWCVWGHDLYPVRRKQKHTFTGCIRQAVHCLKKLGRGTYLREHRQKNELERIIGKFRCILIGYPYDRIMLRKRYGPHVPIEIAPYFSDFDKADMARLAQEQSREHHEGINILIGHCGFHFIEHETYLRRLHQYCDENIRIHLVLSYGASSEEAAQIRNTALHLFRPEQIQITDQMMAKDDYHKLLSSMDIAIFPYLHQSGVFNTVLLSYLGKKMYFAPGGVLYQGFLETGLPVYDCTKIGKVPFSQFAAPPSPTDDSNPLYDIYDNQRNIQCWTAVLQQYANIM